ncbi:DNA polymerase III subunit beta [Halonatronum saccharophilum]|uniref:DNA polymerase III subunit beta n=1 Tax=Halonatronum saccharophilum TaxID=150060 RepID=UPI000487D8AB|nr:DNA polymerase III subunit beta [Halonatronum saccharophilum]
MKVKVNQESLYNALKKVNRAVSSKATLPILSGIALEGYENNLRFIGTDLQIGIESNIKADIIREGSIVLPAQFITDIIKELPKGDIIISADSSNNTAQILTDNSKFNLYSSPTDQFPLLPELDSDINLVISQKKLKKLIRKIIFATSDDSYKAILAGALLVMGENQIEIIATDTYRLVYHKISLEDERLPSKKLIIPNKTLKELENLLNNSDELVHIILDDNKLSFKFSETNLITRTIEGDFPNYKDVIPKANEKIAIVKKEMLFNTLKRANLLKDRRKKSVDLKFNANLLNVEANSPGVGNYHEGITLESKVEQLKISFDVGYLLDCLKVIDDDEIIIRLSNPLSPALIKPKSDNNYKCVIMPIR